MQEKPRQSNSDTIMFGSLGYTYKDYLEMGRLNFRFPSGTLQKVFDMSNEELIAIAEECGVVPGNGINPNTTEGLELLLLWLYLSGRIKFYGLNNYASVEYNIPKGSDEYEHKASASSFDGEAANWVKRLLYIMAWPKEFSWTLHYIAKPLVEGDQDTRYTILQNMLWNCGKKIIREDYKAIDSNLNVNSIQYRKVRVCNSRVNLYCMWDRLRIAACHLYKGNKKDFISAMQGNTKCLEKIYKCENILVGNKPIIVVPDYTYKVENKPVISIMKVLKLGL